jgi:hypothetical protein
MRTLQDTIMTRTKTVKRKKVTGVVSALSAGQIRVDAPNRKTWNIKRKPTTKVTVISGKPLRRGSKVTVEFKTSDGKQIGAGGFPGRRTERGTVISLTDTLITLDNTTPDPKTWTINKTPSSSYSLDGGTLAVGSWAKISADDPPDWKHIA